MNLLNIKKAQEFNPVSVLLAVVGAVMAWVMATRMDVGALMKIIIIVLTGVVCYFVSAILAED